MEPSIAFMCHFYFGKPNNSKIHVSAFMSNPSTKILGKNCPQMNEALLKAAAVIVPEGVDLSKIPDKNKDKKEFLELVEGYLNNKINSLQKARLEYLADHMEEVYQFEIQKEEKAKARAIAEEKRKKREKEHKMLRRKTKKGQPVLRNLAKIQLEQVKRLIEKEKAEENN